MLQVLLCRRAHPRVPLYSDALTSCNLSIEADSFAICRPPHTNDTSGWVSAAHRPTHRVQALHHHLQLQYVHTTLLHPFTFLGSQSSQPFIHPSTLSPSIWSRLSIAATNVGIHFSRKRLFITLQHCTSLPGMLLCLTARLRSSLTLMNKSSRRDLERRCFSDVLTHALARAATDWL